MVTQLRVYRTPEERDQVDPLQDPSVRVRLGDLLPLVALGQRLNFIWLKDFLDDEVCITQDLQDVLETFRGVRPSA